MLIISQLKTVIVSTESVYIYTEEFFSTISCRANDGNELLLGSYNTTERAKAVLLSIISSCAYGDAVFYMPPSEEPTYNGNTTTFTN